MHDEDNVGQMIRKWREYHELSSSAFAKKMKVSSSQLSRWEHSRDPVPLNDKLLRLADYLNKGPENGGSNRPTLDSPAGLLLLKSALLGHLRTDGRQKLAKHIEKILFAGESQPKPKPGRRFFVRVMGTDQAGVLGACGSVMGEKGYNIHRLSLEILATAATPNLLVIGMEVRERCEDPSSEELDPNGLEEKLRERLANEPVGMSDARVYVSKMSKPKSGK